MQEGKATFTNRRVKTPLKLEFNNQKKVSKQQQLLASLVANCQGHHEDTLITLKALREMLTEAHIAESQFDLVFKILDDLEGVDASRIEQLFYYKLNAQHDFEQEARKITLDFKLSELENTGDQAKEQMKKDVIRRKHLLKKLVTKKIVSN